MPNRRISDDVKWAAIRGVRMGLPEDQMLKIADFSKSTLDRIKRRLRSAGTVSKKEPIGRSRPRALDRDDLKYLLALVRHSPTKYLDEFQSLLLENRALDVSISTIHRSLEREGYSYKFVQKVAAERDPALRADFVRRIGRYPPECIVCIDETSKDERTYFRSHGRSKLNTRVEIEGPFIRGKRYSLLPAMDVDGIFASKVVEGSFTHDLFYAFLQRQVVRSCNSSTTPILTQSHQLPKMQPFPGPRSVLVMDNARIHHSDAISELVARAGSSLHMYFDD